ncbi:hypothetical protein L2E82_44248 [Cichorium intybus]|uniref:Uncharacterized protein n=1 Tax=Cichorium intybus TaxID=13427 RepID=A0ACB8ZP49_CICIN|nr:hypothetical protein L2E82_44248 [Cichorium intybus]
MVSCEEITVMRDMASARVFVEHLGLLLKQCKANIISDTNKAFMDEHGKPLVEMYWAWELQRNLGVIIVVDMRSIFWHIERLINYQLSALKRAVMLPIFLSMCQDAAILTNSMMECMKTTEIIETTGAIV